MYTVVRFIADDEALLRHASEIGNKMNEVIPGIYTGIRKAKDGFACSAGVKDDWDEHIKEVIDFVTLFKSHIAQAVASGLRVVLDTAIDKDDIYSMISCFKFNHQLLKVLVDCHAELEITLTCMDQIGENDSVSDE